VKDCGSISDTRTSALLCALFHVLALILHEDLVAREIASKNGFIKHVSDLLSQWSASYTVSVDREGLQVPKWVTTAFLAIDQLLQVDQKLSNEILDLLKSDDKSGSSHPL
jgi:E3 ubiquitin-protein ligase HUWE1